jgi:hypothetical protein
MSPAGGMRLYELRRSDGAFFCAGSLSAGLACGAKQGWRLGIFGWSKQRGRAHELGFAGHFRERLRRLRHATEMPGGSLPQRSATSRRVVAGGNRTGGRGMGDLDCVFGAARVGGRVAGNKPGAGLAMPRLARRRRALVAHAAPAIRRDAPGTSQLPAARMELDARDKQLGRTHVTCSAGASGGASIA